MACGQSQRVDLYVWDTPDITNHLPTFEEDEHIVTVFFKALKHIWLSPAGEGSHKQDPKYCKRPIQTSISATRIQYKKQEGAQKTSFISTHYLNSESFPIMWTERLKFCKLGNILESANSSSTPAHWAIGTMTLSHGYFGMTRGRPPVIYSLSA